MRLTTTLATLALVIAAPVWGAINPANYQNVASDVLRIRETARIVDESTVDGAVLRRVTLVGEVIEQADARAPMIGKTVVIDYTVNLTQRERAAKAHDEANGQRPGPQFMHDPDPPALDVDGAYWAHLAPVGGRLGNVNRHSGAEVEFSAEGVSGDVFVPVAGQYSFSRPMR